MKKEKYKITSYLQRAKYTTAMLSACCLCCCAESKKNNIQPETASTNVLQPENSQNKNLSVPKSKDQEKEYNTLEKSKVLADSQVRSIFVGFDKIKRIPPDESLRQIVTHIKTGSPDLFLEYEKREKATAADIEEARKSVRIGVPYERYVFPDTLLLKRKPISASDLENAGYAYPLMTTSGRFAGEVLKGGIVKLSSIPDKFWPKAEKENGQQRVYVSTQPYMFSCYGIYPEETNIENAIFRCTKMVRDRNKKVYETNYVSDVEVANRYLSFEEICKEAQTYFDEYLRATKESKSSGYH